LAPRSSTTFVTARHGVVKLWDVRASKAMQKWKVGEDTVLKLSATPERLTTLNCHELQVFDWRKPLVRLPTSCRLPQDWCPEPRLFLADAGTHHVVANSHTLLRMSDQVCSRRISAATDHAMTSTGLLWTIARDSAQCFDFSWGQITPRKPFLPLRAERCCTFPSGNMTTWSGEFAQVWLL
jgi:hypothetical protein